MWQTVRTILLVTMVSVLVWVWAETESLSSALVTPRIQFEAPTAELVASFTEPGWKGTVRANLRGSTAAIDAAQRLLTSPITLAPGFAGVPSAPGDHQIDLREVLRDQPSLRKLGITFAEIEPATVRVHVDRVVIRVVPVRARLEDLELDGEAVVSPATTAIAFAAEDAARLPAALTAMAEPGADALRKLGNEASQTIDAAVRLADLPVDVRPLSIKPDTVQVTFKVRSRTETWVIPTVPVWISIPPTEGGKWDVQVLDPFIKDVSVTGPRELIRAIREGQDVPRAQVLLGSDDLDKRIEAKEVVFSLVPSALKFSAANLSVRLKITERAAPKDGAVKPPAGP